MTTAKTDPDVKPIYAIVKDGETEIKYFEDLHDFFDETERGKWTPNEIIEYTKAVLHTPVLQKKERITSMTELTGQDAEAKRDEMRKQRKYEYDLGRFNAASEAAAELSKRHKVAVEEKALMAARLFANSLDRAEELWTTHLTGFDVPRITKLLRDDHPELWTMETSQRILDAQSAREEKAAAEDAAKAARKLARDSGAATK